MSQGEPIGGEETIYCLNCSAQIPKTSRFCKVCGARNLLFIEHKDRITAGLIAVMLSIFGGHKFYLKNYAQGVIYLIFFWTLIPAVLGIIEGIRFLTMRAQIPIFCPQPSEVVLDTHVYPSFATLMGGRLRTSLPLFYVY